MSLLYFGFKFLRLKVHNTAIELVRRPIVLTENYPWPGWDTFRTLINVDVQNLNNAAIGAKTQAEKNLFDAWAADGEFVPLSLPYGMPETVFIYHHTFSAACSSVRFKQLREAGVKIIAQNIDVKKCRDHSRKEHDLLQPFFCDDYGLEILYGERVNSGDQTEHYKLLLESIRNNHHKICGFFMDENDWTARFVDSMNSLLQALGINDKYIISDTTKDGLQFQSFQQKFSGFQRLSPAYIFHGSPDVTIECESSVASLCLPLPDDTDTQLSKYKVIEMAGKLTARDYTGLPDKVGELVANLHWLLVANIINQITARSENTIRSITSKGLLIDKMQGCGILCMASGQLCDVDEDVDSTADASQFVIKVSQPYCGRMKPSILCHLTKKLLE